LMGFPPGWTVAEGDSLVSCDLLDERFGFTLENYAVEYHHGSMLNIDITYRLITTADINVDNYPDSVPMAETVIQFITDYPTKTDYWEIINKKLTRLLLDRYPQMSGITSHITIISNQVIPFTKESSLVTMNRPGYCPIS
ncbi:MAG: hypothetical protein F6K30_29915, partial [Cyanothece sp. SIO2G6]|nr:hypothetical protein [Cyanothece sp. SIO2G6]